MFGTIALSSKALAEYQPIIGEEALAELDRLARPLRGVRVLHLSVAAFGTAVADTLSSLVPLMNDLGLPSQWQVLRPAHEFIAVNKVMYEALAGVGARWNAEMESVWQEYAAMNAELFAEFRCRRRARPRLGCVLQRSRERPAPVRQMDSLSPGPGGSADVWQLAHRCADLRRPYLGLLKHMPKDVKAPGSVIRRP
jgi:trehalose synthase